MLVDIIMPKLGESIMDGRILKWHKKPGEKVQKDETLFEISTDKVDTEVPSAESGVLVEILYNEGDTVDVEKVVARIETDASKAVVKEGVQKATAAALPKETAKPVSVPVSAPQAASGDKGGEGFYSPLVMNIASQEGVSIDELSKIKGTGVGGRIRKQDILAYVEKRKTAKPTAPAKPQTKVEPHPIPVVNISPELTALYNMPGVKVIPMDNIQEKMAAHMVMSVHTSPHVGAIAECDFTAVERAKKSMEDDFMKREGFKLTYMPFICEAVVKALKDFPLINASIDGTNILVKDFINIGIAVAMDNGGLIVPVIKNADSKSIVGLARDIYDLAGRARIKKLKLDEIENGTFTITNYGVFGNIIGTPLINQPQLAILGTGAIKKRAVVIDTPQGDAIVIKPIMYMTLSFDHRLIDGALGGKFLMKIVEYLENYII
ncbi:MAG: dihydrolipoamide acetyltransferase family protein [Ignavibacteria bacterium]|jgi:2-oxoglutarate dehydrogenase E2 component (dihydrolipoamide succinyltransferase)